MIAGSFASERRQLWQLLLRFRYSQVLGHIYSE
jgi:hypothetical protein